MVGTMTVLRDLIRSVIQQHPTEQIPDLIKRVVEETQEHEVHEFLSEALHPVVYDVIKDHRNYVMNQAPPRITNAELKKPQIRSLKQEQIANWYAQLLTTRVSTASGEQKLMGDCTLEDMDFLISVRQNQVSDLKKKVEDLTRIRNHMEAHGAHILREAPEMTIG